MRMHNFKSDSKNLYGLEMKSLFGLETKQEIIITANHISRPTWARSCPKKYHKLLCTPPLYLAWRKTWCCSNLIHTQKSLFHTCRAPVCVRARWWIILLFELMNAVCPAAMALCLPYGLVCVKSKTLHAQNVSRAWFTRGVINSETSTPAREHYHNSAWFTPARSPRR